MHIVISAVQFCTQRLDKQTPALRHGVSGVDGQIHDHLFHLVGVRADRAEIFGAANDELDVLADQPGQQPAHLFYHLIQIHDVRLQNLLPAESEELAVRAEARSAARKNDCTKRQNGPAVQSILPEIPRVPLPPFLWQRGSSGFVIIQSVQFKEAILLCTILGKICSSWDFPWRRRSFARLLFMRSWWSASGSPGNGNSSSSIHLIWWSC